MVMHMSALALGWPSTDQSWHSWHALMITEHILQLAQLAKFPVSASTPYLS